MSTHSGGDVSATWTLRGGRLFTPRPPFGIMGIVNVTPDSFYDGGRYETVLAALARALDLLAEGADILDVGAESSRPGALETPAPEELERLIPVLDAIKTASPRALVSVDCWKADTAAGALEAGADIINDISAGLFDPALADVLGQYKPGYVLMHSGGRPESMQRNPSYGDVVEDILAFFEKRMAALTAAGLPEEHMVLDPGIGFGKTIEHNLAIMSSMERFRSLGRPILAGVSMKSLFNKILAPGTEDLGEEDKIMGTQTAIAFLSGKGVALHRVHHVAAARNTLRLLSAFGSGSVPA